MDKTTTLLDDEVEMLKSTGACTDDLEPVKFNAPEVFNLANKHRRKLFDSLQMPKNFKRA